MTLFVVLILMKLLSDFWFLRGINMAQEPEISEEVPSRKPAAVSHAKYAYLIGSDEFPGRTNNKLMAVVRGLDYIFDTHGELNMKEPNAILAISGWARDTMKGFFFNETRHRDWGRRLEQLVPIITMDRLLTLPGKRQILRNYTGRDFFHYKASPPQRDVPKQEILKKRRALILGPLFSNPSQTKMKGYHRLQKHLEAMAAADEQLLPGKYMAIHSRSLEGSCQQRLGNKLPGDECDMSPAYVKRLLQKVGFLGRAVIVVITDMQNEQVTLLLKSDPEIGKHVVVPTLDIAEWKNETLPATDMMIAIKSDAFAGTRVSTMAIMIGIARVATGKDPQTNLVYVDSDLNVCEECIYYCNSNKTSICGRE